MLSQAYVRKEEGEQEVLGCLLDRKRQIWVSFLSLYSGLGLVYHTHII